MNDSYAMKWGMVGYEEEEVVRPQFEGEIKANPVDGKPYLYFDPVSANARIFVTSMVVVVLTLLVVGIIAFIFYMRILMTRDPSMAVAGVNLGGVIASVMNALQIQVFNAIYGELAIICNNYENHRTDTQYEDALISKTFVFQFVNSYASLFYVAFVKPFIPEYDACLGDCMMELSTTLGTIFLMSLTVGNITKVVLPALTSRMKLKSLEEKDEASFFLRPNTYEHNDLHLDYQCRISPPFPPLYNCYYHHC